MGTETVEIAKNTRETLRVRHTEYKGTKLVEVWVWTGRPGDVWAERTQKGLKLRPETWGELLPAIQAFLPKEGE